MGLRLMLFNNVFFIGSYWLSLVYNFVTMFLYVSLPFTVYKILENRSFFSSLEKNPTTHL